MLGDPSQPIDALTVPQVARRLQIGKNQAYALVREGRLYGVTIHRAIRVPVEALERFLAAPGGPRGGTDIDAGPPLDPSHAQEGSVTRPDRDPYSRPERQQGREHRGSAPARAPKHEATAGASTPAAVSEATHGYERAPN